MLSHYCLPRSSQSACNETFYLSVSILYVKRRTILGLALAPIVEAGGGNVGMSQPLLDFGNVGLVGQRIRRRRRPQRMHTQPDHFKVYARFKPIFRTMLR